MEDVFDAQCSIVDNWNELSSIFDVVSMMTLNTGIDALNNIQVKQGQGLHSFIQRFDAEGTRINRLQPDYLKKSYYT